jgi:[ribosomal protein S18]-alanine N-acetyltransferase
MVARPLTARANVRLFQRRDLRRVIEIERECFGKDAWPERAFVAYLRESPELFFVARYARRIAGYSIAQINWRGAELESIAVDPRFRGRGIAQALLDATVTSLKSRGVRALRLMVSIDNPSALRFYRRYGFVRMRLVKRYYGAGRDAWRMRLDSLSSRPKQQGQKQA